VCKVRSASLGAFDKYCQHQQQRRVAQIGIQLTGRFRRALLAQAERVSHRFQDQLRVAHWGQVDKGRPLFEILLQRFGYR